MLCAVAFVHRWISPADNSTSAEVGSGESIHVSGSEMNNITDIDVKDIPPDMNIANYHLHFGPESCTGNASKCGLKYMFERFISSGTFSRNVSRDQLCTKAETWEKHENGSQFDCMRDLTGNDPAPDAMPPPYYNGMCNMPKACGERCDKSIETCENQPTLDELRRMHAAPLLDVSDVQLAKVTIRPAVCLRPEHPQPTGDPWPAAPPECPPWYLEVSYDENCTHSHWESGGSSGNTWTDLSVAPPCWKTFDLDPYLRCETGSCFLLDFHVELGGQTLEERTVFGDPQNSANGYDSGTFFLYDPEVLPDDDNEDGNEEGNEDGNKDGNEAGNEDGNDDETLIIVIASSLSAVVVLLAAAALAVHMWRKRKTAPVKLLPSGKAESSAGGIGVELSEARFDQAAETSVKDDVTGKTLYSPTRDSPSLARFDPSQKHAADV